MISSHRLNSPLTLTFSLSPLAGRRWRQPDEGRMLASLVAVAGAEFAPLNVSFQEARHVSHS
ncbi:hypothetical protein D3C72_2309420 [compost metagenome]